ncbi:MAG: cation:proton antiporter [Devosia sp.]
MSTSLIIIAIASVLVLIALVEAAAERLAVPQSVMLAALGMGLGLFASIGGATGTLAPAATVFSDLPLSSETFTLLLLPPLLFDAALKIDTRRMLDDAAPVFLLAVLAVCVSTVIIGLALAPVATVPLLVCLLVGAVVSTTDPLAVIGIFRDVGAPARLVRIIEGESLLNDAAAIALFTILMAAITGTGAATFGAGVVIFFVSGVGGLLAGALMGFIATPLMNATRHHFAALMSVTLALPYLAYVVSEAMGVSGAMAVVMAGLVTASRARSGQTPPAWRHVRNIWNQIAFWASSLVFVLAAFLIPKLLTGFDGPMLLACVVLVLAAFAARAVVLWGLLPLLPRFLMPQTVDNRAKTLLWWGGLRGALTLILALAVTEHADIPREARDFVAVLATAFTLFTIFVNGLTLRALTRILGLDRLSAFDRSLRGGARALAASAARGEVLAAAQRYGISPAVARDALAAYAEGARQDGVPVSARERLTLALVVLSEAERATLNRHGEDAVISPRVAQLLNREAQRIREAARVEGRSGYLRAAARIVRFPPSFRAALLVQRWIGVRRPLAQALEERFERLMVRRIVLGELAPFVGSRIAPVLGERVADLCKQILARRRRVLDEALDALTLQYPSYARALEQRFLERIAVRQEAKEYQALRQEQLIGVELMMALSDELGQANRRLASALTLDLNLDLRRLVEQLPLFSGLPEASLQDIVKLLKPRFIVPGERIIRRGEKGDSVYFIASGAVEVDTGHQRIRLGRGAVVGELAAFSGGRRSADVTVLGYGELLVLQGRAFRHLLDNNAKVRAEIERIVVARQSDQMLPDSATQTPLDEGGTTRHATPTIG